MLQNMQKVILRYERFYLQVIATCFRGRLQTIFPKSVIVTFGGGGGSSYVTFCLPTKCRYIQTTLFGTVKVGTIYDHPTTQYEQFIERYYGRHKGSGKSKATVISDRQVILLNIGGVTFGGDGGGGGGGGGVSTKRHNDVILEKNSLETPP